MKKQLIAAALGAILAMAVSKKAVSDEYTALAFSPDSTQLATGWTNGRGFHEVRFHHARTGDLLASFRTRAKVDRIVYSSDGTLLATLQPLRGGRHRVEVFDLETEASLGSLVIDSVSMSGRDQIVLLGSVDTVAVARTHKPNLLWNFRTNGRAPLEGWSYALARSTNDQFLIYGDGTNVRMRRVTDGQPMRSFETNSPFPPTGLSFGERNSRIAILRSQNVEIWSVRDAKRLRILPSPSYIRAIAYQPSGVRVATAVSGHPVQIFNARTGKRLLQLEFDRWDWFEDVDVSAKASRVAALTTLGKIRVWNILSGKLLYSLP